MLDTFPFGGKKRLHVAKVGEKLVLLSEGEKGIYLVMELGEDLEDNPPVGMEKTVGPEAVEGTGAFPREVKFPRILKRRAGEDKG